MFRNGVFAKEIFDEGQDVAAWHFSGKYWIGRAPNPRNLPKPASDVLNQSMQHQ